jgi:NitT/TauT family transport system ATP-binding protein
MDEPFAALDDITRQTLNADLLRWWQPPDAERAGGTTATTTTVHGPAIPAVVDGRMATLFVTHSVAEAVFLSQRVLVMAARPGRVVAELAIAQPYPREPGFRHAPAFVDACRQLGDALLQAHGAAARAAP